MYLTPFMLTQNIALDNALSTIQVIHQLISKINDVITELNNINVTANDYTDEQIRKLTEKIDSDLTALEKTLKAYSDAGVSNLKEYVDTDVANLRADLNTAVTNLKADIKLLERDLKLYSDVGDSLLKVYINTLYDELLEIITNGKNLIYSPIDGGFKSVKDAIFDIANIVQQKNGIDWNTFETLCNGESVDMTGYTQPNNDYNIWLKYEKPAYATTDYLDINGLHIICSNAISSILIDNEPFTDFTGGGVLFPLNTFNSSKTTIVITDMNNKVTTIHVKNTDYSSASVTWESLQNKLNVSERYNNWNALSFYTVEFANNNLMATDGKMKDVLTEIMYTTEFNKKFFGGI